MWFLCAVLCCLSLIEPCNIVKIVVVFSDRKAMNVNDIVTVIIRENANQSSQADRSTSKDSLTSLKGGTFTTPEGSPLKGPLNDINKILEKLKGVDEGMLTSLATIEEENKLIFNNGIKTGIKSGIRQSKVEIIKNMLKENLSIDLISKITGISPQEINKMK